MSAVLSAALYVPTPCVLIEGSGWRPKPNPGRPNPVSQAWGTKHGEPSGRTKPRISQPQPQSHYLDRASAVVNPANFRGPRCLWDARPHKPKSEASSGRHSARLVPCSSSDELVLG